MATIKDIAREAGVSVASVSRYFNNKELLSKSACDAIEKTVNKYGYVPNSIGRSLRVARSGKILIVLPTLENPMYLKIITAIENECYQYGYTALTCDTHRDAYKERYILSMLENHYALTVMLLTRSPRNILWCFAVSKGTTPIFRAFPLTITPRHWRRPSI